jgi:hypothetical protein
MKTKYLIIAGVLFTLLSGGKCRKDTESCHFHIKIVNNSNKSIYLSKSLSYPDTSILDPNPYLQGDYHLIQPGRNDYSLSFSDCYESVFNHRPNIDKLIVFVFDSDVLANNSWSVVKQNYMILKRIELSLIDLENKNWTITYP